LAYKHVPDMKPTM